MSLGTPTVTRLYDLITPMRWLFGSTFVILMGLCGSCALRHSTVTQPQLTGFASVLERIRPSIVQVRATFGSSVSTGTGFFINEDGVVVTARHVIHIEGLAAPDSISVLMRLPTMHGPPGPTMVASFYGWDATVTAEDPNHDVAILTMGKNPFKENITGIAIGGKPLSVPVLAATLDESTPKDGTAIFVSGFPLGLPTIITSAGYIASSDPISFNETTQQIGDIYWADVQANHGNSGGPVMSIQTGSVLGMQVGVLMTSVQFADGDQANALGVQTVAGVNRLRPISYNAGIAQVIPASYITALLRSHAIRFNVPPLGRPPAK